MQISINIRCKRIIYLLWHIKVHGCMNADWGVYINYFAAMGWKLLHVYSCALSIWPTECKMYYYLLVYIAVVAVVVVISRLELAAKTFAVDWLGPSTVVK